MITHVEPNRVHHIMQSKHAWTWVGASNWTDVSNIINTVLKYGTSFKNQAGNIIYSHVIDGHTIEVVTRIVDDTQRIVDAWVKTR